LPNIQFDECDHKIWNYTNEYNWIIWIWIEWCLCTVKVTLRYVWQMLYEVIPVCEGETKFPFSYMSSHCNCIS